MMIPVGFCVLVRPDEPKDSLKSDTIVVPDTVTDKWRIDADTGTMLAIGPLAWKGIQGSDGSPWANIGDHVVYARYGGKLMTDPETQEKYLLLQDKDIIGVLNG